MSDALIDSLAAAVDASPDDDTLRLHLAELLIGANRPDEAVTHVAAVIGRDPLNEQARALMSRAIAPAAQTGEPAGSSTSGGSTSADPAAPAASGTQPTASQGAPPPDVAPTSAVSNPGSPTDQSSPPGDGSDTPRPADPGSFDWNAAESEVSDLAMPMFVEGDVNIEGEAFEVESPSITLADVGGMKDVKKRINASFLAPLRNKELRDLYGANMRGGLLLYGPPGCGKTFLARAVAGELGANFVSVSLADIFDHYIGETEKNIHQIFELARAKAPCVLFLDELDAIGLKRTKATASWMRSAVNQLLTELDGVDNNNDGVFLLAASNHPWDIDSALLRPGRLDRMVLVLPPDTEARQEILKYYFSRRPVEGIDVGKIAKKTDGYSGADLAFIVDSAAEVALMDSVESGHARLIQMKDVEQAMSDIRPSVRPWMETAKNVVTYADPTGQYDELAKYIRKNYR